MVTYEEKYDLLKKFAYLDQMIQLFQITNDPTPLRILLDDPTYADILIHKFFYPSRNALLQDTEDYACMDKHILGVTSTQKYWFNSILHSPMHTMDKIRVLFVFSGTCVCCCETESFTMESGHTCIVPAGVEFSYDGFGENCILINVLISEDYMQRTLMNKSPQAGPIPTSFFRACLNHQPEMIQWIKTKDSNAARDYLLSALYEYRFKRMYYYEALDSYIVLFFTELLRTLTADAEVNHYARTSVDKRITDIRRYIETHYADLSLSKTAEHFYFTPSYLSQIVHKNTGMTFTRLVQEIRLQNAIRLLLHSTMSISEIISAIGYQNASYFYRIFIKKYGCTPSEYRKKNYGFEAGRPSTDNTLPI